MYRLSVSTFTANRALKTGVLGSTNRAFDLEQIRSLLPRKLPDDTKIIHNISLDERPEQPNRWRGSVPGAFELDTHPKIAIIPKESWRLRSTASATHRLCWVVLAPNVVGFFSKTQVDVFNIVNVRQHLLNACS